MPRKKADPQTLRKDNLPNKDDLIISPVNKKTVGGRIQEARKRSAEYYTQPEVASILKCSTAHISEIENGKTSPNDNELSVFCKLYGITLEDIYEDIIPVRDDELQKKLPELLTRYAYRSDEELDTLNRGLSYWKKELEIVMEFRKSKASN